MSTQETEFDTFVAFSFKGYRRLKSEGGSGSWECSPNRAMECKWLLVTHNQWGVPPSADNPAGTPCDADVRLLPHRAGFLLGKVKGVRLSKWQPTDPTKKRRYIVEVSAWANLPEPLNEAWNRQRNPFRYARLADFDIDPEALDWQDAEAAKREMAPFAEEFEDAVEIDEHAARDEQDTTPMHFLDETEHGTGANARRTVAEIIAELKQAVCREVGDPKAEVKVDVRVIHATSFRY